MRRTKADAEVTRQKILSAAERVFYEKGVSNTTLDHLANRSVVLRRGASLSATAKLKVLVDGPNYGTGPEASVLVIRTNGASSVRSVNPNANGNGNVTVAFGSAIARVIVITTNGSSRYTACYSNQTPYACFGGVPLDQNRPYSFRAIVV